jgi:hypothetical protein
MNRGLRVFQKLVLIFMVAITCESYATSGGISSGTGTMSFADSTEAFTTTPFMGVLQSGPPFTNMATGVTSSGDRQSYLSSLINATDGNISLPGFPRAWIQEWDKQAFTTSSSSGLGVLGFFAGVSFDYKWTMTTTVTVVGSITNDGQHTSQKDILNQLFVTDPKTGRAVPNVQSGQPMFAFCDYQAALNMDGSKTGGYLNYTGVAGGFVTTTSDQKGASVGVYSKFFQLDGSMTELEILNRVCLGKFKQEVVETINADLKRMAKELKTDGLCDKRPDSDGPDGDISCMGWFYNNYGASWGLMGQIAAPRCVPFGNSTRCELVAKKAGVSCPLEVDSETHQTLSWNDEHPAGHHFVAITNNSSEFLMPCDASQGLKCQMDSKPKFWSRLTLSLGTARCIHN